mgnify:FL=1
MKSPESEPRELNSPRLPRRTTGYLIALIVALGLMSATAVSWMKRSYETELARAGGTLELQVLVSRLGAAAIQAEYGRYDEARQSATAAFDGIVNHGIEQGALPENYDTVLRARDEVMLGLAQGRPEVTERLVDLFFLLQLPVDTELDSKYIIPATDSGVGMVPPRRMPPSASPDTLVTVPDTLPGGTGPGS